MRTPLFTVSMQPNRTSRRSSDTAHASDTQLQELRRQVSSLREIPDATANKSGREFLRALAVHLAGTLRVSNVLIVEPVDGRLDRGRTLVAWGPDGFAPDFEFDLGGTGGAGAMVSQPCYIPHSAQEMFPADVRLRQAGCVACGCAPLRGSDGALLGFIEVQHNRPLPEAEGPVTMDILSVFAERASGEIERLRMREALRDSDHRFRSITEGTSDLILVVGFDGRISYANPSAERVGGYRPAELQGRSVSDFVHPDDLATVQSALETAAKTEGPAPEFECRVRLKTGTWLHLEARGNALLLDPFVRGIIINARNITDRRNAESRIAFQGNLLQRLSDASPDALLMVSADREVTYLNPRFATLWEITGPDGLRRESEVLAHIHPKVADSRLVAGWQQALEADPTLRLHDEFRLRDGRCLELLSSAAAHGSADNRHGRLWSFRDVTERKNLEARLLHVQRLDTVGFVASGIAHEFCNILLPVQLGVGMIRMELPLDHPLQTQLDSVELAADRARDLARHLLTLGRSQPTVEELVELEPIVSAGVKLLRASLPSSVLINLRYSALLPSVFANPVQIQQALLNLGINSWQAMPLESGTIDIVLDSIQLPPEAAPPAPRMRPGKYLRIAFSDNGQGIDPGVLTRIFEPFFTTKPAGQGTGLGLATVKTIVDSHRGFTTVESEPGRGTTFRVYLPAADRT
jgi:PAS domain S-box-containing protein